MAAQGVCVLFFNNLGNILLGPPLLRRSECEGPPRSGLGDGHARSFIGCQRRSLRPRPSRFCRAGDATTRLTLKASPVHHRAQELRSSDLLDPQSDKGRWRPLRRNASRAGQPGGQMNAAPQGGNESEQQRNGPGRGQIALATVRSYEGGRLWRCRATKRYPAGRPLTALRSRYTGSFGYPSP